MSSKGENPKLQQRRTISSEAHETLEELHERLTTNYMEQNYTKLQSSEENSKNKSEKKAKLIKTKKLNSHRVFRTVQRPKQQK